MLIRHLLMQGKNLEIGMELVIYECIYNKQELLETELLTKS